MNDNQMLPITLASEFVSTAPGRTASSIRLLSFMTMVLIYLLHYLLNHIAWKVTLVGMVLNKLEKVTDVQFVLDDGTGRIDVTRWYMLIMFLISEFNRALNILLL